MGSILAPLRWLFRTGTIRRTNEFLAAIFLVFGLMGPVVAHDLEDVPFRLKDWYGWRDSGVGCLDQREFIFWKLSIERPVLGEIVHGLVRWDENGCQVVRGFWFDPVGLRIVTSRSELEVIHFVSPREAHELGGWRWTDHRRSQFFNEASNLAVVEIRSFRKRKDRGPLSWVPGSRWDCHYISRRKFIKVSYGLSTEEEAAAFKKHGCRIVQRRPEIEDDSGPDKSIFASDSGGVRDAISW